MAEYECGSLPLAYKVPKNQESSGDIIQIDRATSSICGVAEELFFLHSIALRPDLLQPEIALTPFLMERFFNTVVMQRQTVSAYLLSLDFYTSSTLEIKSKPPLWNLAADR